MLEQVNLDKRKSLKQKIVLGLGLVAGLIGLSSMANASTILYRSENGTLTDLKNGYVQSSTTSRLTVSTTAPSTPATNDLWLDIN